MTFCKQIRHDILNRSAPLITPADATKMAEAAVNVLKHKEDELTEVLAAGEYIARRDAEALRLLAE